MKLTILGTAGQLPTRTRSQNAYFLDWPYGGILFDPGEGTQRQFTLAGISPGRIHKIVISHFHGDHCLGLPGILQRLSLMEVPQEVHIYYPQKGQVFMDALYGASKFTPRIQFHFHPLVAGLVEENENYKIEAFDLKHSTPTLGYRLTLKSQLHFDKEKLHERAIEGPILGELQKNKEVMFKGKLLTRQELSYWSKEKIFAYILDTGACDTIPTLMKNADAVLMEATYLETEAHLAKEFNHMTAERAALYAKDNDVKKLILTHFSERYKDLNICQKAVDKIYKNAHISHDFDEFEI